MSSKIVFSVALALASLLLANIGSAEDAAPLHKGPWPIRNGRNYQPTEYELRALHEEDVTPGQAREIDHCTINSWRAVNGFAIGIPHPYIDRAVAESDFFRLA